MATMFKDLVWAPNGDGGCRGGGMFQLPVSPNVEQHVGNIWSTSGIGCCRDVHGNELFLKAVLNNGH